MRIDSIAMINVTKHVSTHVHFPQKGVLMITGKNGEGKSSFIEAIAMGVWGKTLRGKTCWTVGAKQSLIVVESGGVHIERSRKGARTSLTWTDGVRSFERTSDAQDELDKAVVPFDVWRRAAVLSSSDAAHFTLATDQERKRLIESITGLDVFDDMADKARELRKAAAVKLNAAEAKLASAKTAVVLLEARINELRTAPMPTKPSMPLEQLNAELAQLREQKAQLRQAHVVAAREAADLARRCRDIRAAKEHAQRQLAQHPKNCPTCGAAMDPAAREHAKREHEDALLRVAPTEELEKAEAHSASIAAQFDEVVERKNVLSRELDRWDDYMRAASEADTRINDLEGQLLDQQDDADSCAHKVQECTQEFVEYQAAESILSTRGIRASLLSDVLAVVEAAADRWLAFLPVNGAPLKLKLSPYTERANSVSDALSLEIEGAGAGLGYKAASAGERRRIDLAVMLALQEVAESAHGVKFGTVFIDEAFDALDADVLPEAVEMLRDLAEDRCVVLITHNEMIAQHLGDAMVAHMHVAGGTVRYV